MQMKLYFLAYQMIQYAKNGIRDKVMEINRTFERQMPKGNLEWMLNYDNLRQDCILSFIHPSIRDKYIKDAQERYERIGKI